MKKLLLLPISIILVVLFSCGSKDKKADPSTETTTKPIAVDSLLVTDSTWGPITSKTDLAGLQAMYGASNLKDDSVCGAECADTLAVTLVYPGTSKQITVYWKDSAYHKSISMLEVFDNAAPYKTDKGLKVGSTLADLSAANGGKQIDFYGFDWDYGGTILSYHEGKLDKSPVQFRLMHDEDFGNELMGEGTFDSNMPTAKKYAAKIYVATMTLGF